ncbi:hypothetical protein F4820DRAFT_462192 [Hypoxylon rubiginosum]|uniref:Uncharacterized protein n=1 Tax=Hypoxylon rubiginosum TaxID=110542 RepID=A0ACB9YK66_9PEZI|nr:hypothetical protein F4820DRAFT_462192 [Hypoxylon rubiginosum]
MATTPDQCSLDDGRKRWNVGMEMPKGKPRPTFIGESEKDRRSGSGTIEDPMIVWLGKIPDDAEVKTANEDIARQSAEKLEAITHIYIRCAVQDCKFIDRDGKRIHIWNPDSIHFHHGTATADPHMSLAFGTNAYNLVLYGYVYVDVDEDGKPTGLATGRDAENVDNEDDRVLELFVHDDEQLDCAPYCTKHMRYEALLNACQLAGSRACPRHEMVGLLDHWCRRTRWRTEAYDDHYCPCRHKLDGVMDHYCPCPHDQSRRTYAPKHCRHNIPPKAKLFHYCPFHIS